MKPTDLWGGFPPSLVLPEACKPNRPDHLAKPRGNIGSAGNIGHILDHRTGFQRHAVVPTGLRPADRPSEEAAVDRSMWPGSKALDPRGSRTGVQRSGPLTGATMAPGTKRTKFRGGVLEEIARYPSWSAERKNLSAILAEIPRALALLVIEAAERDLAAGARPVPTMLWHTSAAVV